MYTERGPQGASSVRLDDVWGVGGVGVSLGEHFFSLESEETR